MPSDRWADKEIVVYLYIMEYYSTVNNYEAISVAYLGWKLRKNVRWNKSKREGKYQIISPYM